MGKVGASGAGEALAVEGGLMPVSRSLGLIQIGGRRNDLHIRAIGFPVAAKGAYDTTS